MTPDERERLRREIAEECAQLIEIESAKVLKVAELLEAQPAQRSRGPRGAFDSTRVAELHVLGAVLEYAADLARIQFGLKTRSDCGLSAGEIRRIEGYLMELLNTPRR